MLNRSALILVVLTLLMSVGVTSAGDAPVDFNRDIKPLLANRCFACHGPDEAQRQAELRLDRFDGATADRGGYRAITPGKVDESELIRRVRSEDEAEVMPPPEHGRRLSEREIERLEAWIKQGANYTTHWSYVLPVRRQLATVTNVAAVRNAIDRFVIARLESEGLSPSPPADRLTLLRRVTIDLTGLPPTRSDVADFLADEGPHAYERLVERLLENEAYGERWASVWLDLARYADTAGYAEDLPRTIWAFRDYVIRSLNDNKPFDQFTIEQLAGDLLPEPTEEQLIATAFHRNTLTNSEGGTDDEEFRNAAIIDRVNTTMSVWMGTTMACAQCHNHKYDPLTQEEYFRLFAFFNNTADADRPDETPVLDLYSADQKRQEQTWRVELARLQADFERDGPEIQTAQQQWEDRLRVDSASQVAGRYVRVEIPDRMAILSMAEVQVFRDEENVAREGRATQSSTAFGGAPERGIDGNTDGDYQTAQSTTHTDNEDSPWWQVELSESTPIDRIVVWNRTDNGLWKRLTGFRVSILDEHRNPLWQEDVDHAFKREREFSVTAAPAAILAIVHKGQDRRSSEERAQLAAYFRSVTPHLADLRQRIAELEQKVNDPKPYTTVPIMRELLGDQRRETHIQIRGNFLSRDKQVTEGLPAAFHSPAADAPLNRLTLAKWLVDRDNPLTARVIVNRYWEKLFGAGLVATSEEFGTQGERPTHPELLDWLAVELMDSGWDLKHLVRLIVTSATYRQSSQTSPEMLKLDPFNRLLTRGPRVRLSAEMIRDQALAVSGLLSRKMCGPPVQPPQPKVGLKAAFGGKSFDWKVSEGEDRYRRGLYVEWRRTLPYPSMDTFDAPSRQVCEIRRSRTNTPLQALVTLNDPVYVECAQALARRLFDEVPSGTPAERAAYGFELCLIRPPTADEVDALVELYESARGKFSQDADKARAMATDPLGPVPKESDVTEMAAWTVVSNVLLNLDEMFQKP